MSVPTEEQRNRTERLPLNLPAAWRGEELFQHKDWLHELSAEEIADFDAIAPAFASLEHESAASDIVALPTLKRRSQFIQDSLEHGSGAAMIRGLPVERFSFEELKRLFLTMARRVGTPISQSAAGETIFSVRNEGFAEHDPRARGPNTKKRLSFHTDRCDVIAFLCVKQAKSGGENQVVSSVSLYNEILRQRPDLLEILMQPFYYQRHNVDLANASPYTQQPIFSIFQGYFAANFLRVLIERAYAGPDVPDMTGKQREALDFLEQLAADPALHVTFKQGPGDILFLNNWVTFHRRNEFEDYDELDNRRHLLRIWLSVPNSRPLDPMFAGNYGATAAGAIRGGMRASTR